jgi:hypothetical protein
MQKFLRCIAIAALAAGAAAPATAGELKLTMANGRVTLIADEVPVRQILAEWARVGQTKIVNADKVVGPPLTLQLVDCPEDKALEIVLRSAAGYMAAPRPAGQPGAAVYDRILILATSRPPTVSSAPPPAFNNRQVIPQPMPVDEEEPDLVIQPPGSMPPGANQPGFQNGPPGQMSPQGQPVLTAPRPGPLPTPAQPGPNNPYVPGQRPPGTPARPGGGPGGGPEGDVDRR